jgi:dipeptidyl aminopeptidase/acylaminoacyl peptidase
MRRVVIAIIVTAFFIAVSSPVRVSAQTPSTVDRRPSTSGRPFTFDDMMALKRVGEPAISPNGKWVAFSVTDVSLAENTRTPHLWVVSINGGDEKQITKGAGESRPQWSPDGKLLSYVSSQDGESQVWAIPFDDATGQPGPEPGKKLTNVATGADGQLWSPDGRWLMFTSSVYPDCKDEQCNKDREEAAAKSKVKAMIFRHLLYRHWSAFLGDKVTHIFIQSVSEPTSANSGQTWGTVGTARDLTPGAHDAPPFSLGGSDMYAFSPDSKEVAFTSNIDEVAATSTNNEIFIVPVEGGTPKKISTSPGSDSTPRYSPDGKYIAWLMQETPGYESDRFQLALYDRKTGQIRSITKDFDRWVGGFAWAPDSKDIYFAAEDEGESPIWRVSIDNDQIQRITKWHDDDVALTGDGKTLVFTRMSVQAPAEIYAINLDQVKPWRPAADTSAKTPPTTPGLRREADLQPDSSKAITHLNDTLLSNILMSKLYPFHFIGAAGRQVEGFIIEPPNFDASTKYPVKFLIHGGPEGAWGDSWSYRWNAELFAANGYVVVMINPTGSTGYGQAFTQAIQADWGGRPYEDLMKGLDYALAHYPFLDGNRMCALGASYGGYMANWLLGHTTRFKCIVSHDGMFNTISAYGTTEELWFPEWEFKGTPWTSRAIYDKWSPSNFIPNFKTPTLVIHSQHDYRLDVSEGFQLFTALQKMKVPSKMLYFPDESHFVLKPQNSQLWYKTVNDWVDQWTKKQ